MTPRPAPWSIGSVLAPTGRQAAEFDRTAIESGVSEDALMERAGTHAAQLLLDLFGRPRERPVLVLAGRGNNGGDGIVLARALHAWGVEVQVLQPDGDRLGVDRLRGHDVPVHDATRLGDDTLEALVSTASIVVDALLGTGLEEAPRGEFARLIEHLAHARGPIVSLDVPSGVSADDGSVPGVAVRADATIAFGFPKLGTLLHPGRARSGRIVSVEIGFPPVAGGSEWYEALTPEWARTRRPRRRVEAYKNTAGVVAVVAGSLEMGGAAILAARSALRSGAGFVRLVAPAGLRDVALSALPEVVFVAREDDDAVAEALSAAAGIVVGPGMGTDSGAASLLDRVLTLGQSTVVDADALTLLADRGPAESPRLRENVILTPHPGEAARLLGRAVSDVESDRPGALEELLDRRGGTVVLKGTPTLVGSGGRRLVDTLGSSDLAVAGIGDTLAGAIASVLAQGATPFHAAGVGMALVSRAVARIAKGEGLQTADVAEEIPGVLAEEPIAPRTALPFVTFDLPALH